MRSTSIGAVSAFPPVALVRKIGRGFELVFLNYPSNNPDIKN
jgi:hypothetical protein